MKILTFKNWYVKTYSAEESFLLDDTKYVIQQAEHSQTERTAKLLEQGFEFHERFFWAEAELKTTAEMRSRMKNGLKGVSLEMNHHYTEDMYELAYASFDTDRRFHLERRFDQDSARPVKESYLNWCRDLGMPVFSARREKELLGYIVVDLACGGGGEFRIMLGVTQSGIKGKFAAFPLYGGLLERLSMPENGGYTKYCCTVSTANIAALNLHMQLGAKVKEIYDEYIYRNTKSDNIIMQSV